MHRFSIHPAVYPWPGHRAAAYRPQAPGCPVYAPGPPPCSICPVINTSPRRCLGLFLTSCLNCPNWLLLMLMSIRSTLGHPVFKAESSRPSETSDFCHLYPLSNSSSRYPELMTTDESTDVNRQLHFHAQLSLHHNEPVQHPHHCRRCSNQSASLPFNCPLPS